MKVNYLTRGLQHKKSIHCLRLCCILLLVLLLGPLSSHGQCSGVIYDTGGSSGDYSNYDDITTVLDAGSGNYMNISFLSFNIENGYDFLYVYDGSSTSAPLIGTYSGTSIPPDITSTGQYLTIRFVADYIITRPGYAIELSCIAPPPVPDCLVVAESGNGTLYSWTGSPAGSTLIGTLNATNVESMALSFDGQTIYAVDAGTFGTVNHITGAFTAITQVGNADGALGTIAMDDVDGLAINPNNGLLMATQRRSENDLLFVINPTTGMVEKNYFGPGVDYREIVGALEDMDDIAFNPNTDELFGISTVSNADVYDIVVIIDQYLGTVHPISSLPTCDIEGLTFNDAGILYGSSGFEECGTNASNTIYEIDYSDSIGAVTPIVTIPSSDTEAMVCFVSAVEPCDDVASGGSIGSYQEVCEGSDVAAFTNVESASVSSGASIEYQWFYSTTSCISPLNNDPEWIEISGATGTTYDHGIINEKTCFVRGAKTNGCPEFVKFSNVITVDVSPCSCPSPNVVTYTISSGNDDVEEAESGSMYTTSSDLEFTFDTFDDAGNQTVGMRFNGINIPTYASIQSATLSFTADEDRSEPTTLIIEGELAGNSSPFSTTPFDLSSRDRTTSNIIWSDIPAWQSGNVYNSVQIGDIISEIIQQGTWNSGNSLTIIITGTGRRTAESFDKSNSSPVQLTIEYCDEEICDNGTDDDGDGYPDSFDPDCPLYSPFACDKTLFQSFSPDNGANYYLDEIETDPLAFTNIYNLTANGMSATGFNALAFNPVDRFLYGLNPLKTGVYEFFRINNSGDIQYIGDISGMTGTNDAGCMADDGTYYVGGTSDRLYTVNLSTLVATEIADLGFAYQDMAINPMDGLIYMWNSDDNQLYAVDPSNGSATAIGSPNTQYGSFGSMFFNEQGDLLAYGDDLNNTAAGPETLVHIDTATGAVTALGTGPEAIQNDGCSCTNGIALTKEASANTIEPGQELTYTFTIYNRSSQALSGVDFIDNLPSGITFASNPYNVSGITIGSLSIIGSSSADFEISNIPPGVHTFMIDVTIPFDYCENFSNQARLENLGSDLGNAVNSDDPSTADINDATTTIVGNCEEYYLEAECENVGSNWIIVEDSTASRYNYATIGPGNNSLSSPPTGVNDRIRFTVNITNAGDYNIFARVWAPNSNDDSFWVRANGGTWVKWNNLNNYAASGWTWGQVWNSDAGNTLVTFPLSTGVNTIDFAYREDGTRLDKISVSLNDDMPTGEGGISTNCPEICDNGEDDDGDGLTDCADDDCAGEEVCQGPCDPEKLFVERWFGISGSSITDLTSHPDYPESPSELDYITSFQGPNGYADNYGTRVRGFIIPPESGTYTFNVTGDDNTILYLSSDINEFNSQEIASVSGWSGVTEHNKYPEQTSTEFELLANVWYYVELIVKEGTGGDHFQVYWRTPSVPNTWNIIPGTNLAPFICPEICENGEDDDGDGLTDCMDPDCANGLNVYITSMDNDICIGETATLNAEYLGNPGPLTYVWSNGGGTSAMASVSPSTTTTYVVTVTNTNGCEATDQIQVTVNPLPVAGASNDGVITCANPTVQLTATPPGMSSYFWSGGGIGRTFNVTSGGTYTVTVTDANGCSSTASTTVNEDLAPPIADAGPDQEICIGDSAILNASGGVSYAWSNGATSSNTTVGPTSSTNYTVTVTAANGCTDTDQVRVTVNPLPTASITKDGDIQCDNASVALTASPSGMTYQWSTGDNTEVIDVSTSGTYTVTVTDGNGCSNTSQIVVDEFLTPTPISCERYRIRVDGSWSGWTNFEGICEIELCEDDGLSDIQIDGGPDINSGWVWRDEDGNIDGENDEIVVFPDIQLDDAGIYTGEYTNEYGCVSSISINVIVNANPVASAVNNGPITCSLPNVTLTASPVGMIYTWEDGSTGSTNMVNMPGTYTVTVTNASGCTDIASTTVLEDTAPPTANAGNDVAICPGESVTLIASGGGTYNWSNGAGSTASVVVSPLTTTTYVVTVTAPNGCTDQDDITVTVNTPPTASATNDGPITCSQPAVTLTASPAGMSYTWEGGGSNQTKVVTSAGIYRVTVTDSNGCTDIASTTVTDDLTPPIANAGEDAAICIGEDIDLTATGGVSYQWSNDAGSTATVSVSPLATTIFTVTVTASNGCTDTDQVTLTVNDRPNAGATNDGPITCNLPNVTLTATPVGMTYAWSGGGSGQTNSINIPGSYTVTVTNANGCTEVASTTVAIDTLSPPADAGPDQEICFGDTTNLLANGGISYIWSEGAGATAAVDVSTTVSTTYTVTVTGTNGCTAEDEITVTVNELPVVSASNNGPITCNLPNVTLTASPAGMNYDWAGGGTAQTKLISIAGTYDVTITDSNGCTAVATTVVTDDLIPPTADAGEDAVICVREDINLTASGGISYAWSNGAGNTATVNVTPLVTTTYTVTVTAANGCTDTDDVTITVNTRPNASASNNGPITCALPNVTLTATPSGMSYAWSDGGTNETKEVTVPGIYSVTVTNANGCTETATTVVAIDTLSPVPDAGPDQDICFGDTANLLASGGISYAWSNGAGNTAAVDVNPTTTTVYTVTVTAANGCTDTDNITITVNPLPIVSASNDGPITCAHPDVTLTAFPAGMSYAWSGGGTAQDKIVSVTGVYTVTITDGNGCTAVASSTVTDDVVPPVADAGADVLICEGESTTLTATGGITYEWSDGAGSSADVTVSPITTTTFTVTVTAANGCQDIDEVTVLVDPKPIVDITGSDVICIQTSTTLSPSTGGTWQSSDNSIAIVSSSGIVYGLNPGTVSFVFTSSGTGCVSNATADITVTPDISVSIDYSGGICLEDDTELSANIVGGTGGFIYNWSGPNGFSASTETIEANVSGNYYLTVTDGAGCSDETSAFIYEAYEPFIFTLNTEVCEDESITLSVNSSSAVSYQWGANAGNSTDQSVVVTPGLPSESYFVTVTNGLGCTTEATVEVDVKAKTDVSISGSSAICIGETTTLTPSSGGYWTSADNTIAGVTDDGVVTGLSAGAVTFTFYDSLTNCVSDPTLPVTIYGRPDINVSGPDVICEGDTTTLSPSSGGTWISNDPSLATVTDDGIVTAISAGSVSFVFTDATTGCPSLASTNITINPVYTTSYIGLSSICIGEQTYLSPSSGGTWESADESIASVSNIGVVTAHSTGTTTFTFTSDYSCVSGATAPLTVYPPDTLYINGDTELCVDEVISLQATAPGGTWSSSNNTIASVDNAGNVTGIAEGIVTITYTHDPATCANDPEYILTVRGKPTVMVNGPIAICAGEVTGMSASSFGGTWSSSDESVAIISNDGTVVGINGGTATFTYTDTNTCTSDASIPIDVSPPVTVDIDFIGSVCLEPNTRLAAVASGGTSSYSYYWSGPGGFVSNQDTIDVPVSGLYNVLVTDDGGCTSNRSAYVYEAYNPFVFTLDTEVCEGESVALAINGSSGGSYQWSANAGSATTQSISVTPSVPGETYYVTITSPQGCTTVANAYIAVETLPVANLSGPDQICVGGTTDLTTSADGLWSSSDYSVASITNDGVVTGLSAGAVTFTFRDTSSGCYSAPTTSVTVTANEDVLITGDNDLCLGIPETISASEPGGSWSIANPSVATISAIGEITPVAAGSTSVLYTPPANTCLNVSNFPITVNNLPAVDVNGPSSICEGEITFLVPSNGGVWESSDPDIATVSPIGVVTAVSSGSATFTFTSNAGCVQTLGTPITVISTPTVSLTGPASICVDEITTLSPTTGGLWISSNNNVATVSSSGLVIGKAQGIVEFSFIEFVNGCTSPDVIEVTVKPVPGITGFGDDDLCVGETTSIGPTVGGTWQSSNTSVASIEPNGTITALSAGAATFQYTNTITGCTSESSGPLTVDGKPVITIAGETQLCVGENSNMLPSAGGIWSTSDVSVATITSDGTVTAISAGEVTFTFTSNNTGCSSDPSGTFTVSNPGTADITGPAAMCIGTVATLVGSTPGIWESNNTAIASVNSAGIVTANAPGIVTITLNTIASCLTNPTIDILVEPNPNPIFTGPIALCLGESTTLSPTTGGIWSSSDPSKASVDNAGNVVSIASGVVNFTFTNNGSGCSATTSTSLNVYGSPQVEISGNSTICIGESTSMSPSSGGSWTSSDETVALIDGTGQVTGISAGTASFTFVESGTGCVSAASDIITVLPKPAVSITGPTSLCIGSTSTLSPSSGGSWISNNENVATVTDAGEVTAVGQGVARFTFVNNQGCASNETNPIVVFGTPSVTLNGPSMLCVGQTVQMLPASGGTWTSNNEGVATIANDGTVTTLAPGTVRFTYTDSATGCVSAESQIVTVNQTPTAALIGPSDICIGTTTNFTPTSGGVWTSLEPTIATIQNNGEVTGVSAGIARFLFTELASGCVSDTSAAISVESKAKPVFSGPDMICLGDTTYITPATGGTWTSSNEMVATISNSGEIIGVGQGTTKFRFTNSSTGCVSDLSNSLTVNDVGTVLVDGSKIICIGTNTQLSPNSGGSWASLNPSVASVTSSGLVTGLSPGTANFIFTDAITGCTSDGTLSVDVQEETVINVSGEGEVCIGYSMQLMPNSGGFWESNNESIATITNTGIVRGRAPGKVTFTFTESNSGCVNQTTSDSVTVTKCSNHDFNVALVNEEFFGNLSTNDNFPVAATYSTTPQIISKPEASIGTFNLNADGSYSFKGTKAGNYRYKVPICLNPFYAGCPTTLVEFTLVANQFSTGNPVANLDIITIFENETSNRSSTPGKASIKTIQNDVCVYTLGCDMDWGTTWIEDNPTYGNAAILGEGIIDYTPNADFIGFDTIYYGMCADGYSNCNTTMQVITVNHNTARNSVVASDDFKYTLRGSSVSGNILENDSDAEGDSITVIPQGSLMVPIVTTAGEYFIDEQGDFTFTPNEAFSGHTEIIYEVCDDNTDQACMEATLHLLVFDDISVSLRVYLQGALMQNGGAMSNITGRPLMRDDLRNSPFTGLNYIPVLDPYSISADPYVSVPSQYDKIGPGLLAENLEILDSLSVFSVTGDNAIVDWVHVELRSKEDPTVPIATRSGLLQRDGDVVDLDGVSNLRFNAVNVDSFYVVVKHRSHLGVMSQKVARTDMVDFTSPTYPVYNFGVKGLNDFTGLSQNVNVISGYAALWAGDFDSNGIVKFTNPDDDQNVLFIDVLFTSPDFLINYDQAFGYLTGDFNMNSKTKYTNPNDDTNYLFSQILLYPLNTSFLSNFNSLIEQIPEEE